MIRKLEFEASNQFPLSGLILIPIRFGPILSWDYSGVGGKIGTAGFSNSLPFLGEKLTSVYHRFRFFFAPSGVRIDLSQIF